MKQVGTGEAMTAFYAALGSVESVRKSETADMGRYVVKYASLNAVHAECQRACENHGLQVCQEPTVFEGLFAVVNTLLHRDGSAIEMEPMCLPMPKEAQALGSATTYLRRYSLVSQFGLAVEDDDGQAATTAAQTAPGRRTEAERLIREQIAGYDEATTREFRKAFLEHFKSSLNDLPASKHGDALTWARAWKPPTPESTADDAADKAWVDAAKQESPS